MMALLQIIGIAERKLAMAKAPTLARNKTPIPGYEMKDGKLVGKPSHAKLSRPAQYAKNKKTRYKAVSK